MRERKIGSGEEPSIVSRVVKLASISYDRQTTILPYNTLFSLLEIIR